jgi:dTDP-glucose pyrophosphorylase
MQGVVPAAGEGTRLRPLTAQKPKGLVEVGGSPLLTHCFESLLAVGVDELVVIVGYRKDAIIEHYGDGFRGIPITYVDQDDQLGLGHALRQAAPHVEDDFVHLNGDNVFRANIDAAVARQRDPDVDAVLLVEDVSRAEARTTGVLETEGRRVTGMVEKPDDPPSTLVSTGCYVLPPAIFRACHQVAPSTRGEYELSDAIDRLVETGATVEAVPLAGWRVNVNEPADIERAEQRLR